MCKSQAEGGQRCAAHARTALDRATAAMNDAIRAVIDARMDGQASEATITALQEQARAAADRHTQAEIEYASTPAGEAHFRQRIADFATNPTRDRGFGDELHADLCTTVMKGLLLREQNKAHARDLRLAAHPRGAAAAAAIAQARHLGLDGWAGANRALRAVGVTNVTQDRYLANAVAEHFGFGKNAYGKAPRPAEVRPVTGPDRTPPPPLTAAEFNDAYLPEYHPRTGDATTLHVTAQTPQETRHWWTAEDNCDGTLTYHAGIVTVPNRAGFVKTALPWRTGQETASLTYDDAWERHARTG